MERERERQTDSEREKETERQRHKENNYVKCRSRKSTKSSKHEMSTAQSAIFLLSELKIQPHYREVRSFKKMAALSNFHSLHS